MKRKPSSFIECREREREQKRDDEEEEDCMWVSNMVKSRLIKAIKRTARIRVHLNRERETKAPNNDKPNSNDKQTINFN